MPFSAAVFSSSTRSFDLVLLAAAFYAPWGDFEVAVLAATLGFACKVLTVEGVFLAAMV